MKGLNNEEIIVEDLTPIEENDIKQPDQDVIVDEEPEENFNKQVFASMMHAYPPLKIFDLKEIEVGQNSYFIPKLETNELEFVDNRYCDVSIVTFNTLIDNIKSLYFRISEDLFSLLDVDYEDNTMQRDYGCKSSRKTFILLLKDALIEYTKADSRILETRMEWLKSLGTVQYTHNSANYTMYKFKFIPNWIEWIRGLSNIKEEEVILPFKRIINVEAVPNFGNDSNYAQNSSTQTFYSYRNVGVVSYICEYPFIYSITPEGNFSNSSAVFEVRRPKLLELILAKKIAMHIKRNVNMIQLPGTLVNYNFDDLIQELNDMIQPYSRLSYAESISNYWNRDSRNK